MQFGHLIRSFQQFNVMCLIYSQTVCSFISLSEYHFSPVAVGERIAYWIRTPQVPGSRPGWYGTFYWASDCWPPWQHQVERSLVCVEGRGRISRLGLTQDIKMGSCVFQCEVPHRWIAQRQVWFRVCILWRGGVSCPVSAACHSCVAAHWSKYHCYKQAPSWYDLRCFKATLNPNKQTNKNQNECTGLHNHLCFVGQNSYLYKLKNRNFI